jgi:hypothetical protein
MIKKRYILIPLLGLVLSVLVIGAIAGYILFFRNAGDTEMVFASTEVGTPEGDKVTKNIGPEGGSITSPDGRLTLTVPEDALTETLPFSIQPVTNKFEAGLGLSYRLEPEGKTFATPLDISVHYDDHDLEGTFPEAFSLAYQDKDGAWHMQQGIELNKDKKTVTLAATHFSVYAFIYLYRLSPAKATVHVGESVKILATYCHPVRTLLLWLGKDSVCDHGQPDYLGANSAWKLQGEGKLTFDNGSPAVIYTAPGKKPTPNVATVLFAEQADVIKVRVDRPCTAADEIPVGIRGKNDQKIVPPHMPTKCYDMVKMVPELDTVRSVITIVDRGYRATGNEGDIVWSGEICSLEEPFTVLGSPMNSKVDFKPSSPTEGTYTATQNGYGVTVASSGTYKIEGAATDKPRIAIMGSGTVRSRAGAVTTSGTGYIDLVALDTECKLP